MRNKNMYIGLLGFLFIATILTGCKDDTQIPPEYFSEQYLYVESEHEVNVGTEASFPIIVDASSTWTASSDASWCRFEESTFYGRDTVVVSVDANRVVDERSCHVIITSYFKDNPIVDSVRVVQPLNTLPALEVDPIGDRDVFYKGTTFPLTITYNNGVDFHIEYLSEEEGWITTDPATIEDSKLLATVSMNVTVAPNMGTEGREADIVFVNKADANTNYRLHIVQGYPEPAITAFADNFDKNSTTTGQPYTGEGWTFQSNPEGTLLFKQFNNSAKGMLVNGSTTSQATGYAIWPVFNIKGMSNKVFSYTWGAGNRNPALAGDVFELVASVDYEGDAFSATWISIQNLTNTAESPGISLPNKLVEINLGDTPFANEERVYLAFRYVGGGHAYRIDNLKIGDVEEE